MQGPAASDLDSVWCDGCGAEVTWAPVILRDGQYCCDDCAVGLECSCRDRTTLDLEERAESGARGQFASALEYGGG